MVILNILKMLLQIAPYYLNVVSTAKCNKLQVLKLANNVLAKATTMSRTSVFT